MKNRPTIIRIHASAAVLALATVLSFFTATVMAELSGTTEAIRQVKTLILYALPLLLVAMPTLGISGKTLAGKSAHPLVQRKVNRMKHVLRNGVMLIGLAIILYFLVQRERIDGIFQAVQLLELVLGAANIRLLIRIIRDGMRLSGRLTIAGM
jgi:hypothetical protein